MFWFLLEMANSRLTYKIEKNNAYNSCLAPTLKSCFGTTIILKENNLNFGETIYLKGWAERQAAKRQAVKKHIFSSISI